MIVVTVMIAASVPAATIVAVVIPAIPAIASAPVELHRRDAYGPVLGWNVG
jgi:hypothetical protein